MRGKDGKDGKDGEGGRSSFYTFSAAGSCGYTRMFSRHVRALVQLSRSSFAGWLL